MITPSLAVTSSGASARSDSISSSNASDNVRSVADKLTGTLGFVISVQGHHPQPLGVRSRDLKRLRHELCNLLHIAGQHTAIPERILEKVGHGRLGLWRWR